MKRLFLSLFAASAALADHGPGTSGSGFTTQTAETLKARQWSAALTFEWTEFDNPPTSFAVGKEHFDFIDRSFLTTFGLSFGVTENFQIGLSFGYYAADGTRRVAHHHDEAEVEEPVEEEHAHEEEHEEADPHRGRHGGEPHEEAEEHTEEEEEHAHTAEAPEIADFDPDGWTDLWLTAKYRVYRGTAGSVALLGGVKFPVGETRVIDSLGERVEPASTPGSGAWDAMVGAAYTVPIARGVTLDASAQYTLRGEKFDYEVGNRLDAGVAVGWRVVGDAERFPQIVLLSEATVRSVEKSEERGASEADTGGTALFLSPGVRVDFSRHAAWSVGMHFPVAQDLNGSQVETDFRLSTSFHVAF